MNVGKQTFKRCEFHPAFYVTSFRTCMAPFPNAQVHDAELISSTEHVRSTALKDAFQM